MTNTPGNSSTGSHSSQGQSVLESNKRWPLSPWFLLSGSMLALDQWTKRWIINNFDYGQIQPVVEYFNLTRLHNKGAAFSFLANAGGWQRGFFITLGLIVSALIGVWLYRLPRRDYKLLSIGLALILAGAIGNVVDRIAFGHVIDFLDVYYQSFHWPAFNVADSCIFVGAMCVILDTFVNAKRDQEIKSNAT